MSRILPSPCIFGGLVASRPRMQESIRQLRQAATHQQIVWLWGERGTGRHMLAHCVHLAGIQSEEPFVRLRCAVYQGLALQRELLGSFRRAGVVQRAMGGTLYLEDADFLSPWEYGLLVDVVAAMPNAPRVIFSSLVDLRRQEEEWHWVERLGNATPPEPVPIPPLYARQEDVPVLAERLLWRMVMHAPLHETPKGLAAEVADWMAAQHWPGNMVEVRQRLRAALQHYRARPTAEQLLEMEHFVSPLPPRRHAASKLRLLPNWLQAPRSKSPIPEKAAL